MSSVLLLFKFFRLQALNVAQRIFSWCVQFLISFTEVADRKYRIRLKCKHLNNFIIRTAAQDTEF